MNKLNENEVETKITPDIAYLIGLVGGDGSVTENKKLKRYEVFVIDNCLKFHVTTIKPMFEKLFEVKVSINKMKTKKGETTYRTRVYSKNVVRFFENLGIPLNNKTFVMKTPPVIFQSSSKVKSAYTRGWMDAEGWVTTKKIDRPNKVYTYPKVGFQVANKNIRDDISSLLRDFDINVSTWKSKNMFGLQIIGFEKVTKYLEKIGFNHPLKILKAQNLPVWGQTRPTMRRTMGCNTVR